MRTPQQIIRSQRFCGWFFVFLGVLSLALSLVHFYLGHWMLAASVLPGVPFCIWIARFAMAGSDQKPSTFGGDAGEPGIGKPVPVSPAPTHHLLAAKDLPPSDVTHSLTKD